MSVKVPPRSMAKDQLRLTAIAKQIEERRSTVCRQDLAFGCTKIERSYPARSDRKLLSSIPAGGVLGRAALRFPIPFLSSETPTRSQTGGPLYDRTTRQRDGALLGKSIQYKRLREIARPTRVTVSATPDKELIEAFQATENCNRVDAQPSGHLGKTKSDWRRRTDGSRQGSGGRATYSPLAPWRVGPADTLLSLITRSDGLSELIERQPRAPLHSRG